MKGFGTKNKLKKIRQGNKNTITNKEELIKQGIKFHSQGNISEAIKYYQSFLKKGFTDPIIFSNYGIILKGLGKLREAEISLRKAIELKPDFADAYINLGNTLKDLGRFEEAEIATRKAIELKPNFANSHNNLGLILQGLGKLEEAELSVRESIKIKPDFANAHNNLGIILKDLRKLEEAELSVRKAIKIKPDYANAYNNLGTILKDLGDIKEAEACYCKAIDLMPGLKGALMNRWQLFFEKKEFNKALRDADLCNTKDSRVSALETLFALGRIDEIYDRIEKTSELDDENIRLAAFSSFITSHQKKETAHNFCRNPLSFLSINNLNTIHNDHLEFINEIIKDLRGVKTIWEPPKNTTHNGFHTPSYINLFANCSPKISDLKSIIINELDKYYLKFKNETCSYIQKWPSNKHLVAWHVILKKQGYQEAHIHPGGWLSGVIYLKVVPPLGKNEGAIEFSLNGANYSNLNSPEFTYQPKVGDIVLFPSSLHHRTIPFSTDTERIVLAFDLMPNRLTSLSI